MGDFIGAGLGSTALFWGFVSALSLPIGAYLGILWRPGSKVNSAFMAFGAGALLFALSIELFAHVPHHAKDHGPIVLLAAVGGALLGGLIFDLLNQILNNRGAFVRNLSAAKRYVANVKLGRAKKMVEQLSRVECLKLLSPDQMAQLLQRMRKRSYQKGEKIFSKGDFADELFFIIDGEVEIVDDGLSPAKEIASLTAGETFGEMGILTGSPRTASALAREKCLVYTIEKDDFEVFAKKLPNLQAQLTELAKKRSQENDIIFQNSAKSRQWESETISSLRKSNMPVTQADIELESQHASGSGKNAAIAIWLGIFIDGIPESLVIGMLAMSDQGMSIAFITGVFLANLPEAMSSAVSMKKNGMKVAKIMGMWGSLTIFTAIGAWLGAHLFPANPEGSVFYLVVGIEGLAAGAMLTMIAETMLPEAFEQGGSIVGFSTLLGFVSALSVKVIF